METHDLTPVDVPVDDLAEHPDNPRDGDVGAISVSFQEFGVYQPIVAQRSTSRVLAGNHRLKAARALGHATIPTIWLDVDDVTAMRILVADNRLSDLATYRQDELASLLSHLAVEGQLNGTGYDGDDVDALLAKLQGIPPESDESGGGADGQLAIIIRCSAEEQQRELLDEFTERGLDVRAQVI